MASSAWKATGHCRDQAKNSGVLVFGDDLVAVDATAARLMKIEPRKVKYLAEAGNFLGNLAYEKIEQLGESIDRYQQDFRVIDAFADIKKLVG